MRDRDPSNPVERAFAAVGSGAELARRCGISRFAVYQWRRHGVPAERVPEVSRITGLPKHVLRPDLFDPPAAPQPQQAEAA